jgi:hypothetical protein
LRVPFALLSAFSLVLLATILTFALALNEQESWPAIWRETRRRWLKLLGVLALIALATQVLTLLSRWL